MIHDPFSLPFYQSLLSSAQDFIGSLATPQEADLDDEQIRALLAYDHKFITLKEKVRIQNFAQFLSEGMF